MSRNASGEPECVWRVGIRQKGVSDGQAIAGIFVVLLICGAIIKIRKAPPAEVWIALVIIIGTAALIALITLVTIDYRKHRAAVEERTRVERAAQAAAAKREREKKVRREKRRRIQNLGSKNAALVESALAPSKPSGSKSATSAATHPLSGPPAKSTSHR